MAESENTYSSYSRGYEEGFRKGSQDAADIAAKIPRNVKVRDVSYTDQIKSRYADADADDWINEPWMGVVPPNRTRSVSTTGTNSDLVNHPPHYQGHPKGIECIDVIEEMPYPNLANVVKYAWRVAFGGKWDDIEDLKKIVWYANREIERRTKGND